MWKVERESGRGKKTKRKRTRMKMSAPATVRRTKKPSKRERVGELAQSGKPASERTNERTYQEIVAVRAH